MIKKYQEKEKHWLETEKELKMKLKKQNLDRNASETTLIFDAIMERTPDKSLRKPETCKDCQLLREKYDKLEKVYKSREFDYNNMLNKTKQQLQEQTLRSRSLSNSGLENSFSGLQNTQDENDSIFEKNQYFSPENR